MLELYTVAGGVILAYMSLLYVYSIYSKDASVADVAWGPGFAMLSVIAIFYYSTSSNTIKILVSGMVILWGVRLGVHIGLRKADKPEDWRYAKWRKQWGSYFNVRSFFQIFLLQGLFILAIAAPVFIAADYKTDKLALNAVQIVGAVLWLAGMIIEVVSDNQLSAFVKTKKKGQVMSSGLWRYSRHPNYFGEVTLWWGLWLVVLPLTNGLVAIISPIVITGLILFVSGIPMLERKYKTNPEFKKYTKRTSIFIPMPPKKTAK